jgi:hypothetical protein
MPMATMRMRPQLVELGQLVSQTETCSVLDQVLQNGPGCSILERSISNGVSYIVVLRRTYYRHDKTVIHEE